MFVFTSLSCGICGAFIGLVKDTVSDESTSYWWVEPRRMLNHLESLPCPIGESRPSVLPRRTVMFCDLHLSHSVLALCNVFLNWQLLLWITFVGRTIYRLANNFVMHQWSFFDLMSFVGNVWRNLFLQQLTWYWRYSSRSHHPTKDHDPMPSTRNLRFWQIGPMCWISLLRVLDVVLGAVQASSSPFLGFGVLRHPRNDTWNVAHL